MKTTTVDFPPLCTRAELRSVNDEARTVEVIFSTGAPVERIDYWSGKRYREVLAMQPENIRLDRLNAGAPVLDSHSAWSVGDVLGAIEPGSARVEKGKGFATVRFSKRADVEPIWQDVRDGIIRFVSVGYRVHKFEEVAGKDGQMPTRTAIDWEPYEVSMVPMPADAGAKARSEATETNACVIVTRNQEQNMDNETKDQGQQAEATPPAVQTTPPATDQARAAVEAERARVLGIQEAVRLAKLPETFGADLVSRGVTLDEARSAIFAEMARRSDDSRERTQLVVGEDQIDKANRGVMAWLLQRAATLGLVREAATRKPELVQLPDTDPGEFRGMSLLDIAKEYLERRGVQTRGLTKVRVAELAFRGGMNTTSDFAVALGNVMHKTLLAAYTLAPDTWRKFCAVGSVSDFRAHNRYATGWLSALDAVLESGELKHKNIPDAVREQITAGTKGNILALSRQAIINDDMGVFSRVAVQVGRAVGLSIERDVYATLALNAGLGPLMVDGLALFNAAHANISVGAALSAAAIDADRVLMASQTDPSGNEILDIRPAILVLPVGLGGLARTINQSQYDPDTVANKAQMKPNIVAGLFRDVVDTPRMTGTRRYLFADPQLAPVIEVAFLDGQESPYLEARDGWETDGAEWKIRIDYGVGAIGTRGAVTNAGV